MLKAFICILSFDSLEKWELTVISLNAVFLSLVILITETAGISTGIYVNILYSFTQRLCVYELRKHKRLSKLCIKNMGSWVWWYTPIIPTIEKLKQENHHKFKARLGYIVSSEPAWTTHIVKPCLKVKKRIKRDKKRKEIWEMEM